MMKNSLYLTNAALVVLILSSPMTAWSQSTIPEWTPPDCADWVKIGGYRFGTWGDNDTVFGGERVDGTDKQYNRNDFREAYLSSHELCVVTANNHISSASRHFHRQKREIQLYFEKQRDNCQNHFTSKYSRLVKKLCVLD